MNLPNVSPWSLTVWFATIFLLPASVAFYRLFLHPLARVPGAKLAAVSIFWQLHKLHVGESWAAKLHERYGPVVRVGPNEVIFNSAEAYQKIYRASSPCLKSPFYLFIFNNLSYINPFKREKPTMCGLLFESDMKTYRETRRVTGPLFSVSNVKKYEPLVNQALDRICQRIKELEGKEIQLAPIIHLLVCECLANACYGEGPPYFLEAAHDYGHLEVNYWGAWRAFSSKGLWPTLAVLSNRFSLLSKIIVPFLGIDPPPTRDPKAAEKDVMEQWTVDKFIEARKTLGIEDWVPSDTFTDEALAIRRTRSEFNDYMLYSSIWSFFNAGHDTTTAAFVGALARICTDPAAKKRVEKECLDGKLSHAFEATTSYTIAAIRESMRLHAVCNVSLSRVSPPGGLLIDDVFLPEGTIVGCNPHALHRNKTIFGDDALEFKPDRWISSDQQSLNTLDSISLVFGGASRSCPGQHLARMIIGLALPRLFREFDVRVHLPDGNADLDECHPYFLCVLWKPRVRFIARE